MGNLLVLCCTVGGGHKPFPRYWATQSGRHTGEGGEKGRSAGFMVHVPCPYNATPDYTRTVVLNLKVLLPLRGHFC